MARAIATQEAVWNTAEALVREGVEPTVIAVQARVGGGSYTTTKRLLEEWRGSQMGKPTIIVEMPAEVASKAEESLRALWLSAMTIARTNAQAVADQALAEVTTMRRDLTEALGVVQRLEEVEADLTRTLEEERKRGHGLELQLVEVTVEARRVPTLQTELDAVRREYAGTSDVRTALAELRAEVAALVASRVPA